MLIVNLLNRNYDLNYMTLVHNYCILNYKAFFFSNNIFNKQSEQNFHFGTIF